MKNRSSLIQGVLFWGSLWGIWEIFGDKIFANNPLLPRSVILVSVAILILVASRMFHEVRGFSVAIAFLAAMFKFLSVQFWGCQFFAVILLGFIFEVFWAVLVKSNNPERLPLAFAGAGVTGIHYLLFIPIALLTSHAAVWLADSGVKIFQFLGEGALATLDVFLTIFLGYKLLAGLPRFWAKVSPRQLNWILSASMFAIAFVAAFIR